METKRNYAEEVYHFPGHWEMPSLCGLVIKRNENGALVILTELYEENPGSSVTGMVEELATRIVRERSLPPASTEFIVHNPERSSKYEFFAETFYRAEMKWDGERFTGLLWVKMEGLELK